MSRWLKRLIVAGLVLLLVVGAGVAVLLATLFLVFSKNLAFLVGG